MHKSAARLGGVSAGHGAVAASARSIAGVRIHHAHVLGAGVRIARPLRDTSCARACWWWWCLLLCARSRHGVRVRRAFPVGAVGRRTCAHGPTQKSRRTLRFELLALSSALRPSPRLDTASATWAPSSGKQSRAPRHPTRPRAHPMAARPSAASRTSTSSHPPSRSCLRALLPRPACSRTRRRSRFPEEAPAS